ncbi:adenine phosphoribosyltransferase [Hoyosella subflava]|uniref:Adenine phosphoribosyltransferase n=1 Tax=Hoyosella subflava (strain DSM 45089 / JCM 17490 / NBRC 109087 / DQS3-9A1) TaxID=443218 RepID=F6ELM0_HOYSD|nr:adenine phosphoribosyltransferase [Hoyosella subflava]AEF40270.1 Adenine phosphoribosyltransferase [Hoyosella subflava DQS3-9A1]
MSADESAGDYIARLTRTVPDFPQPGVTFADLTPVFADPAGLRVIVNGLVEAVHAPGVGEVDLVAGIDSRGFLLGSGVALMLGTGVLAIRKAGKLPPPVHSREYTLEYGNAALEIPADGIAFEGRRVLVIDDVLATGGTLCAAVDLLRSAGAEVVAAAVVVEIAQLRGRDLLGGVPLTALSLQ